MLPTKSQNTSYAVITRKPYNIVIQSSSLETLYKYILDISGTNLVISLLNIQLIEQTGSQSITTEATIVKDGEELLNYDIDALTVCVNSDEASKLDWSSDLSEFYLEYFKRRAFNPAPDLSDLKQKVIDNLSLRAEFMNDYERLKLYKDIIQRRFSIKAHEEAFENMATLPNL
jgi:hypothetical protein